MAKRIEINPDILAGKPVIKGTRIPVYLILNLIANNYTFDDIIKAYPNLKKEDIQAAVEYSAKRFEREEVFSLFSKLALQ